MASFVDSTVKEIDDRLGQLKQEVAKLEAARAALAGTRRGPGRPPGSTTRTRATGTRRSARRRTGTRRRRGGNTRANQALELVRGKPGITIPEVAQAMGIAPNYLYRVLPRLAKEGQLRREGNGWHPAS